METQRCSLIKTDRRYPVLFVPLATLAFFRLQLNLVGQADRFFARRYNTITPLSEPIFNEGSASPDPVRFKEVHGSDTALYKQIQKLLTKDSLSLQRQCLLDNPLPEGNHQGSQ